MNKKRSDPKALPYDPAEFGLRHGLTPTATMAVLTANSRSKQQADIGAEIFKKAAASRGAGKSPVLPSVETQISPAPIHSGKAGS